jgi:secondary thiamine-phosphate synthase enzyme
MHRISIRTQQREQLIDITREVQKSLAESKISRGICLIFVPHTTAAVTINENADPSVKADLTSKLRNLIPQSDRHAHVEGNSDAHIKSSLTGSSAAVIVENGQLALGTWQGIQFCEFDGPRQREVWIQIVTDR